MTSLKPKNARVWIALASLFAVLAAVCGAAFWSLQHQSLRVARDTCVERGGTWDAAHQVCAPATQN